MTPRRFVAMAIGLLVVAGSPAAGAQSPAEPSEVTDAERTAARNLGYEGTKLYKAGDYPAALDKLDRAYAVLKVPSLGLWSGRCMEELGQWVSAAERYLETTRLELPATSAAIHAEAQRDAMQLRESLLPRIPRLVIELAGATNDEVQVSIDGVSLTSALVGTAVPVDPGSRRVEVRRGDDVETHEVQALESKTVTLEVTLEEKRTPAPPPVVLPPPPAPPPPVSPVEPAVTPSDDDGSSMRVAGWVSLGIGGAGFVLGAVAGGLLLSKDGNLSDSCLEDRCPQSRADDVDAFNSLRPLTTVGLVVGGIGAATGVALLLLAPSSDSTSSTDSAWLAPYLGPTGAGLMGAF